MLKIFTSFVRRNNESGNKVLYRSAEKGIFVVNGTSVYSFISLCLMFFLRFLRVIK